MLKEGQSGFEICNLLICNVLVKLHPLNGFVVTVVHEVACKILVVCRHVHETVAGKVEEQHAAFSAFFSFHSLIDGCGNRMA